MTISTQSNSVTCLGNGSTNSFAFSFVGDAAPFIYVYYFNGTTLSLLNPSAYTLTLNAPAVNQIWGIGGTVQYPLSGSPISNGTYLIIQRILPLTQNTSLTNQGDLWPSVVEAALDTLEMQIQQISSRTTQFQGIWTTDTNYTVGDIVQDGINGADTLNYYICQISNLSSVWATDLANGDWRLSAVATVPVNPGSLTGVVVGTAVGGVINTTFAPGVVRTILSMNTSYYVSTTGNDSNPGTSLLPWRTIQHAASFLENTIDLNGFNVTVNVADGTYTSGFIMGGGFVGYGTVTFQGDITTPANCIISTAGDCIGIFDGAQVIIQGFKLLSSAGSGITVSQQAYAILGNMNFGACANSHLNIFSLSSVFCSAAYTISGGATNHYNIYQNSNLDCHGITITLTGTPAFSTDFLNVISNSSVQSSGMTFTGSATGVRFYIGQGGEVQTGTSGNLSYFPGNSAGTIDIGGQYDSIITLPSFLQPIKAWGVFTGGSSGFAPTLAGGSGIAGITRNSTGNYTIALNSGVVPDTNYGVLISLFTGGSYSTASAMTYLTTINSTTSITLLVGGLTVGIGGVAYDVSGFTIEILHI